MDVPPIRCTGNEGHVIARHFMRPDWILHRLDPERWPLPAWFSDLHLCCRKCLLCSRVEFTEEDMERALRAADAL